MKRRLLFLSLLVVTLVAFSWWILNRRSTKLTPKAQQAARSSTSSAATRQTPPAPSLQPSYEVPSGSVYEGLSDPRWQWWNKMKNLDRSFEWKIPIKFYGKVIEQDGRTVSGAKVRYGWNDVEGSHERYTQSGADGRIAIEGLHGKILSVDVSKPGYHSSRLAPHAFEYAAFFEADYYRPDQNNPVMFRLVKELDAEPLIARHLSERTTYDHPSYYDLQRGALTQDAPSGAALKFSFKRSNSPQGRPFDWKWNVEAVNGALQKTDDEFLQLAPEGGYLGFWETSGAAMAQPFPGNAQARFYIRTADNRFARADVELMHPNSRALGPRLTIDSFVNPSGSRNLEYDPNKKTADR